MLHLYRPGLNAVTPKAVTPKEVTTPVTPKAATPKAGKAKAGGNRKKKLVLDNNEAYVL